MSIIWHNAEQKQDYTPILQASDLGLRGAGVFDTLLVSNGMPIHAQAHFNRLMRHASILDIECPYSQSEWLDSAQALIQENKATSGLYALNTILTAGAGAKGLQAGNPAKSELVMRIMPSPQKKEALHAMIATSVRRNEGSPLSQIKSLNYGDNILALKEAQQAGADEAIMLNNQGHVTCATIGNLFIIKDNHLYTPPLSDGVMDGIARAILLEQHDAKEKSLTPDDLQNADTVFLSNSIRGLQSIHSINGKALPQTQIPIPADFHIF